MHPLLEFLGVWGAYAAFAVASGLILIWALSIEDDRKHKIWKFSDFCWISFWPLIWLFYRLLGKHRELPAHLTAHPRMHKGTSEAIGLGGGKHFRTIREAKDYIAERISEEADRNGVPLTEVERKMLYFSETGWTLPDMKQVNSEFDRDYDQDEYEDKIGELASKIQLRLRTQGKSEIETWDRAIMKLSQGDHYLLVLVDAKSPAKEGTKHSLTVLVTAFVLFAIVALEQWIRRWMLEH